MKEKFIELVTKAYEGNDNSLENLIQFTTEVVAENIILKQRVRDLEIELYNERFSSGHVSNKLEQLVTMTGITI